MADFCIFSLELQKLIINIAYSHLLMLIIVFLRIAQRNIVQQQKRITTVPPCA